jgi:hypothetical protein
MALLPRLHLFEFLDQPWLPTWCRQGELDYLQAILDTLRPYDALVPALSELLSLASEPRFVDLCSGAGGPWRTLLPSLEAADAPATALLTDLHPVATTDLPPGVSGHLDPVDARDVPAALAGVRTIFEGLHHFRPHDAREILADACQDAVPIAVCELTVRKVGPLIAQVLLILPLSWVFTLLIRPVRLWRLVLTYLVPVIPLLIWWDGMVSSLRTYTPDELREMTVGLDADGYSWEVQTLKAKGVELTVLLGRPGNQGLSSSA